MGKLRWIMRDRAARATRLAMVAALALALVGCGQSGAAGSSAAGTRADSSAGSSDPLKSVTPAELAEMGLIPFPTHRNLRDRQTGGRRDRDDAVEGNVLEARFLHCARDTGFDGDCWVVSVQPPDHPVNLSAGPSSAEPVMIAYEVALVNPGDGKLIFGYDGTSPDASGNGDSAS